MYATQWRQGFVVGALLLAAFWLVSHIVGLVGKAQIAVGQAREVQSQYEALEERKNMLQANLQALETDLGRDAAIRTAFGVARPGEEVIVVVPPTVVATTTPPTWWEKVLQWF